MLLTLGFFAAMVAQTWVRDEASRHDYKSSTLPLLFHGLERCESSLSRTTSRVADGEIARAKEIRKEAEMILVSLGPTEKGWKFVEVDS